MLGQETGQKVQFVSRRWASGISGPEYDNKNGGYPEITVTIRDLLEFSKAPTVIDYFSFDVEGAESIIAKAFPWETTHITTMTVERPKPDAVESKRGAVALILHVFATMVGAAYIGFSIVLR